jgi:hypothetical protein
MERRVKTKHYYHIYMGHTILLNHEPGSRLRWSCLGVGSADTLAGMKRLIREHNKKER